MQMYDLNFIVTGLIASLLAWQLECSKRESLLSSDAIRQGIGILVIDHTDGVDSLFLFGFYVLSMK